MLASDENIDLTREFVQKNLEAVAKFFERICDRTGFNVDDLDAVFGDNATLEIVAVNLNGRNSVSAHIPQDDYDFILEFVLQDNLDSSRTPKRTLSKFFAAELQRFVRSGGLETLHVVSDIKPGPKHKSLDEKSLKVFRVRLDLDVLEKILNSGLNQQEVFRSFAQKLVQTLKIDYGSDPKKYNFATMPHKNLG